MITAGSSSAERLGSLDAATSASDVVPGGAGELAAAVELPAGVVALAGGSAARADPPASELTASNAASPHQMCADGLSTLKD
jgi:hypothetical protein